MAWRQHLDFHPVPFVQADVKDGNSVEQTNDTASNAGTTCGNDVKTFYEQLVGLDGQSTSSSITTKRHTKDGQKGKIVLNNAKRTKHEDTKSFGGNHGNRNKSRECMRFLMAAQEGGVRNVEKILDSGFDINVCDQYGWSALMCAAQAGQGDIVRLLLSRGADKELRDSRGRTAMDIANHSKHPLIGELLTGNTLYRGDRGAEPQQTRFVCPVCKATFHDTTATAHQTSTIHLFNLKLQPAPTMYEIPEKNPGFQMLLRSGWNQEKGLGPQGQGQKFPVKTILKQDRKGLGCKIKTRAKVTHFSANEEEAVKGRHCNRREMRIATMSKHLVKKSTKKQNRKEINFRRDFYAE